jgi:hypothetical protein
VGTSSIVTAQTEWLKWVTFRLSKGYLFRLTETGESYDALPRMNYAGQYNHKGTVHGVLDGVRCSVMMVR